MSMSNLVPRTPLDQAAPAAGAAAAPADAGEAAFDTPSPSRTMSVVGDAPAVVYTEQQMQALLYQQQQYLEAQLRVTQAPPIVGAHVSPAEAWRQHLAMVLPTAGLAGAPAFAALAPAYAAMMNTPPVPGVAYGSAPQGGYGNVAYHTPHFQNAQGPAQYAPGPTPQQPPLPDVAAGAAAASAVAPPTPPRSLGARPLSVYEREILALVVRAARVWLSQMQWQSVRGVDTPFLCLLALVMAWPEPQRNAANALVPATDAEKLAQQDINKKFASLRDKAQVHVLSDKEELHSLLSAFQRFQLSFPRSALAGLVLTGNLQPRKLIGPGAEFLFRPLDGSGLPPYWLEGMTEALQNNAWVEVLRPLGSTHDLERVSLLVNKLIQNPTRPPCEPQSALLEMVLSVTALACTAVGLPPMTPYEAVRKSLAAQKLAPTVTMVNNSRVQTLAAFYKLLDVMAAQGNNVAVVLNRGWLEILVHQPGAPDLPFIHPRLLPELESRLLLEYNDRRSQSGHVGVSSFAELCAVGITIDEIRSLAAARMTPELYDYRVLSASWGEWDRHEAAGTPRNDGTARVRIVGAAREGAEEGTEGARRVNRASGACYNCGELGHRAFECPKPRARRVSLGSGGSAGSGGSRSSGGGRGGHGSRGGRGGGRAGVVTARLRCQTCNAGHATDKCKLAEKIAAHAKAPCPLAGHAHLTSGCSSPCPLPDHSHFVRQCGMGARSKAAAAAPVRRVAHIAPQLQDDFLAFANEERGELVALGAAEVRVAVGLLNPTGPGQKPTGSSILLDSGASVSLVREGALQGAVGVELRALASPVQLSGAVSGVASTSATFYISVSAANPLDGPLEGTGCDPNVRHFGGALTALVVPEDQWLRLQGSSRPFDMLVGTDTAGTWFSQIFVEAVAAQQGTGPMLYTFKACTTWDGLPPTGSCQREVRVLCSVPYDEDGAVDSEFLPRTLQGLVAPRALVETPVAELWANGVEPTREDIRREFWPRIGPMGQQPHVIERLIDILYKHREVFGPPVPCGEPVDFTTVPGAKPILSGLYRTYDPGLIAPANKEIGVLCKQTMAEAVDDPSTLVNINPLVLVPKLRPPAEPTVRITGDFRELNKTLVPAGRTHLPDIRRHLTSLARCVVWNSIDCPLAFLQMLLTDAAKNLLGFCMPNLAGQVKFYRFTGTPLGPATVPGIYQERMERGIAPAKALLAEKAVAEVFIDNTDWGTLPAETTLLVEDNTLESIDVMLDAMKKLCKLGPRKCWFFMPELKSLGGIVNHGKVRLNVVDSMTAWDTLRVAPSDPSIKRLQKVIGAINHAAAFVDPVQYNKLVGPVLETLKVAVAAERAAAGDARALRKARDLSAVWPSLQPTISELVGLIVNSEALQLLDPTRAAFLIADASDDGLGAGIYQFGADGKQRFVRTFRMAFSSLQKRWSVGGREIYGLLQAARRWYRELAGLTAPLILVSDHFNVLTRDELQQAHVARWVAELQALLPCISATLHVQGAANVLCDEWSRVLPEGVPELTTFEAVVRKLGRVEDHPHKSTITQLGALILQAQNNMPTEERAAALAEGAVFKALEGLGETSGALLFRGRLWVPQDEAVRLKLFEYAHDASLHAHAEAALEILTRARVHIPAGLERLREYVKSCPECQLSRMPLDPREGVAPLLLAPRFRPWTTVHMDHFSLPADDAGHTGLVLVVESATRLAWGEAGANTKASAAVAALAGWSAVYPTPQKVVADNGPTFSGEFATYCNKAGIELISSTAYHPRGRGLVERAGQSLKFSLARLLPPGSKFTWAAVLPEVFRIMRDLPHAGLGGYTPADVGFVGHRDGRPSVFLSTPVNDMSWGDLLNATIALRELTELSTEVHAIENKARHDSSLVETKYKVGDTVAVWYPIRETSLDYFWRAPHIITEVLGQGFYRHAELLAGGATGKASVAHSNRLHHYCMDRTTPSLEHQKKLPVGYHVVDAILEGPRAEDGRFKVRWAFVALETWEPAEALRGEAHFIKYCAEHNLMVATGQPFKARTRGKTGQASSRRE